MLLVSLLWQTVEAHRPVGSTVVIGSAAKPPAERRLDRLAWELIYRARMAPVKRSWSELSATIRRGPVEGLSGRCRSFQSELAKLASEPLPPAPLPALSLHLERGLRRLQEAALRCRQERVFDLAYRLYEARRAFIQVEWMLSR